MAAGDVTLFEQFLEDLALKVHDLENDTIKCALIKSAANGGHDPVGSEVAPRWQASGANPDLSGDEVTPGGNYTTGGEDITMTASESGGTLTVDATTNPTWAQHASNPTNARWGIIYNDSAAAKQAIGWVDLGADIDMSAGALTITWGAAVFTGTETAGT